MTVYFPQSVVLASFFKVFVLYCLVCFYYFLFNLEIVRCWFQTFLRLQMLHCLHVHWTKIVIHVTEICQILSNCVNLLNYLITEEGKLKSSTELTDMSSCSTSYLFASVNFCFIYFKVCFQYIPVHNFHVSMMNQMCMMWQTSSLTILFLKASFVLLNTAPPSFPDSVAFIITTSICKVLKMGSRIPASLFKGPK